MSALPEPCSVPARLLQEHHIDAVLDLSSGPPLSGAEVPQGTWRLSHAGAAAEAAVLSAVLGRATTVRSVVHSTDSPPRVVCESLSSVSNVSVARALNSLLWKNVSLVRRGVRRLQARKADRTPAALPLLQWEPVARIRARDLPWRIPQHIARRVRARRLRHQHESRWILLSGRRGSSGIEDIERLVPPPGHYWADPFVVGESGERFVFFEDYRSDLRRGHIAVAPIDAAGRMGPSVPVVEQPYHLSYPFIFQHGGVWHMIPETHANKTIEVYRCERFPDRWRFSHVLMDNVWAVDTTLLQHGGRWWMFTNLAEFEGSSTQDELFAFWADHPLSTQWHPHRANPVVSDVRRARPAGPFVRREGRLLRPSQDGASEYGRAMCLNEVLTLTESVYEERCLGMLQATWDPHVVAMHTISEHEGLVFLDGKLQMPRGGITPTAARAGHCRLSAPAFSA